MVGLSWWWQDVGQVVEHSIEAMRVSDNKGSTMASKRRRPQSAGNGGSSSSSSSTNHHHHHHETRSTRHERSLSPPPSRMTLYDLSPNSTTKWGASPPSSTIHRRANAPARKSHSPVVRDRVVKCCKKDEEVLEARKLRKDRHHGPTDDTFISIYNRSENEEMRKAPLRNGRSQPAWR